MQAAVYSPIECPIIASGSTPTRGPHAKDVRMAVRYVLNQQQPSGLFAATSEEP